MKVAVTGASGFVGQALVAGLRAAAHDAVPVTGAQTAHYSDAGALAGAFEGADSVMHLAARAHRRGSDADFESSVQVARTVAQAARDAGVERLVLVSSIGVNGNVTQGRPFTERDEPAPVEPYARSKWQAEQGVRSVLAGGPTDFVIVRPPLVYGPGAPGNFGALVQAVARGWPLPLASIRNARSLVGLGNLVDFLVRCAAHPAAANELFLIADGEDLSTPDIIRCIARGLGREPRLLPFPPVLLRAAARALGRAHMADSLCDSLQVDASKARRRLGWRPRTTAAAGIESAAAAWRLS